MLSRRLLLTANRGPSGGQQAFTTAGTFSWTAPAGVTSVCVVCVGGGGGGLHISSGTYSMSGGAGGGLGWKNNITVVPGNSYTVVVGAAGQGGAYPAGSTSGGNSYFINSTTVQGNGGRYGRYNLATPASTYVGDGGGAGGGTILGSRNGYGPQGAGGAGGYSGAGGRGGYSGAGSAYYPLAGAGGGGGGGGNNGSNTGYGGGGVGLLGEGSSGARTIGGSGGGGSGGSGGANNVGGLYGGGGGGSTISASGNGAGGAVRIIWGSGRAFPSTGTEDV